MSEFINKLSQRVGPYFETALQRISDFTKRHKIITSVTAVLLVLIIAAAGAVNFYLNKINYFDKNEPVRIYLTLSTGEEIDVTGLTKNADGTYNLSDGRRFDSDGTVWNTDGSIVFYDGSYLLSDGTAVLSDGATIYTDGTVVFQSGKFIKGTRITVDREGYASFPSGEKSHITAFTINEDGSVRAKKSSLVSPKYSHNGTWNIEDLDAKELADAEERRRLEEYDRFIRENNSKIWKSKDVINILLLGIDEGAKAYPYGRSDAMIIVSVNKATQKVRLISLSRAAYSAIPGYENSRLSHAHGLGGPELAVKAIEQNYKIKIDNFASTTFESFKEIIDCFGGVNITLTDAEAREMGKKFKNIKGSATYTLNGEQALFYARTRKIDTDKARTGRQRKILVALSQKIKNMSFTEATNLMNRVLPLVTTDFTKTEILKQAGAALTYVRWDIKQYVLPHQSSKLVIRDNFEVVLVDWSKEVAYVHQLVYEGVSPEFEE